MQETQETQVRSMGQEDPLEEGMATRCSILAWEIPWTEEPDRLHSMGLQRVRHDLVTKQQQWQQNKLIRRHGEQLQNIINITKGLSIFFFLNVFHPL